MLSSSNSNRKIPGRTNCIFLQMKLLLLPTHFQIDQRDKPGKNFGNEEPVNLSENNHEALRIAGFILIIAPVLFSIILFKKRSFK